MSKETAVVYPLIILTYEMLSPGRKKRAAMLSFFFLSALFLLFKITITGMMGTTVPILYNEPSTVIFTMLVVILDYIKKIVFPVNLIMSDAFLKYDTFHPLIVISMIVMAVLFFIAFKRIRKDRYTLFFLTWFFILLLPTSNILPASHFRAERFIYLPLLGIVYMIVSFIIDSERLPIIETFRIKLGDTGAAKSINVKKMKTIFLLMLLLPLIVVNVLRQFDFRDDPALSSRVIRLAPQTREAYQALGFYYFTLQDYQKAMEYFNEALEIKGNYYSYVQPYGLYNNLGVIYLRLNQIPKAIINLEKALAISDEAVGHLNLYYCYFLLGIQKEAEEHLRIARDKDPDLVARYVE
jgi:hypothetical protein